MNILYTTSHKPISVGNKPKVFKELLKNLFVVKIYGLSFVVGKFLEDLVELGLQHDFCCMSLLEL